jgi:hypothetical protein
MKLLKKAIFSTSLVLPCFSIYSPGKADTSADPIALMESYPKDYFISPVDNPLLVSGTFGELRSNHFHAGLDLKSKTGGVGQSVYAAASGYIDQVKVQGSGYGNVLYIKHPNGYSTVYAHLDKFSPSIASLVKEVQYKREKFEVTIDLPKDKYPVRKGEEIGKMGNSGGSTGPHLHFEVRAAGKAINPLLFGIPVRDNRPPEIRDMKLYVLNEHREVTGSYPLPVEKRKEGVYGLKGGLVERRVGAWRVGLGIKVYDKCDGTTNNNGVYALSVFANGALIYSWTAEGFHFDETRYLNAHCDYAAQKKFGAWFHRLFVLPGDKLSMYERTEKMGSIALSATQPTEVTVVAMDAAGNKSNVQFTLFRDTNMVVQEPVVYQYLFPFNQQNQLQLGDFNLKMPKGTLYEDLRLKYQSEPSNRSDVYSAFHRLHEYTTPVHQFFEIGILLPNELPEALRKKAFVARLGGKRADNCGGLWKDGLLTTQVRSFGTYCIMVDNTPPTISPVIFDADMSKKSAISFRITDNVDVTDKADALNWKGMIDGKWVLFEYDKKRNRLTHWFDAQLQPGLHTLSLEVVDDRGNRSVFERSFKR